MLALCLLMADTALAQRKKDPTGKKRPKKSEIRQPPQKVWNSETQRWVFADDSWRKKQADYRYDPKDWQKSKHRKIVKGRVKHKPKGKGKEKGKEKKGGKESKSDTKK